MGFWGKVVGAVSSAVKSVVSAVTGAVKTVENTISSIESGLAVDVNNVIQAIDNAINEVDKAQEELKKKAEKLKKKITTGALFSEICQSTEEEIEDLKNDILSGKVTDIIIKGGKEFIIGAGESLDKNISFGAAFSIKGIREDELPDSIPYKAGKVVGDIASLIAGGAEIGAGVGMEVGGFALDGTVAFAPAGVMVNAGGLVAVGHGAASSARSAESLVDDLFSFAKNGGNKGGSNTATNWKSVKEYGHTFNTHGSGAKNTKSLTDRARSTGNNQGQWLDNQNAAEYLKSLENIKEPTEVSIPEGLGQVITPTGEVVPATKAIVVPSKTGIKTAYPIP